jgi:aryl-alcohol dehydrogenase-like predicted oxidoreductase
MRYVPLGRTGLHVSRPGLGTANFGEFTPEAECVTILDRAFDAGINFIDTANEYGPPGGGEGLSEEIIGRWVSRASGRRDEMILATKVFKPMGEGPNERGLSAYHIRQACEASLKRLRTDRIDLYQMHRADDYTTWDEVWQAMELLVGQGKVLYVGSSNFAGWQIAQAQCAAEAKRLLGLASEQSLYNLHTRTIELEVMPACRALGIGLLTYSPVASGKLAGNSSGKSGVRRARETWPSAPGGAQRTSSQMTAYDALCQEIGEAPADVALAWVSQRHGVTTPIIGPRTAEQLESALRAIETELVPEVLTRLDEIWPGPGEAPESYAW